MSNAIPTIYHTFFLLSRFVLQCENQHKVVNGLQVSLHIIRVVIHFVVANT